MDSVKALSELAQELKKRATEVDQSSQPPVQNLRDLAAIGHFKFVTEASPGERRRALDILSSGCGVTSFLSSQHEGACRRMFEAGHPLIERATNGEVWVGVCFAHLRRPSSPVDAIETRTHVIYSGSGPWFSGHTMMDFVMVGGATPEGHLLMGLSPMDTPEIQVRPLSRLAVMNATATVGLDFNALQVERTDILVRTNPEELAEKDMHSTVFQSARSLGAARAAAEFLPESARTAVLHHLDELHQTMDRWDQSPDWSSAAQIRHKALDTASRVIEAAFVNVGGRSHGLDHPLQRIAREASFYSTTQLTKQLTQTVTGGLASELERTLCR